MDLQSLRERRVELGNRLLEQFKIIDHSKDEAEVKMATIKSKEILAERRDLANRINNFYLNKISDEIKKD